MEIWVKIINYDYEVSSYGRIRNSREQILNPPITKEGYVRVRLYNDLGSKNFSVHRLVAQVFLPNDQNLPEVNHKDENRQNNNVENLEWCTAKYNSNYGNRNALISKPVIQLSLEGLEIKNWDSCIETLKGNFSPSCVARCCKGERQKHKGFKWKFKKQI